MVEGIVVMRKGENPAVVMSSLKEKITALNSRILPDDVKIKPFYNSDRRFDNRYFLQPVYFPYHILLGI